MFHITFAPLSQNKTYRPSGFLGHIGQLYNDFKRISGNKEIIKCKRTKDVVFMLSLGPTGISGLATPGSGSQLNKSSHMVTVGSNEVLYYRQRHR